MAVDLPYGKGTRMLTLSQLCEWLNITQRHARKLVERGAIPYRKVGHLLRFPEAEVEQWCRPARRSAGRKVERTVESSAERKYPLSRRSLTRSALPKSVIE